MKPKSSAIAASLVLALAAAACTPQAARQSYQSASAGATATQAGKDTYQKACAGCHRVMQPKLGDEQAWAPLLKKGEDALVEATIKGKGKMPPQGKKLSDEEVRAAVRYMIAEVKK